MAIHESTLGTLLMSSRTFSLITLLGASSFWKQRLCIACSVRFVFRITGKPSSTGIGKTVSFSFRFVCFFIIFLIVSRCPFGVSRCPCWRSCYISCCGFFFAFWISSRISCPAVWCCVGFVFSITYPFCKGKARKTVTTDGKNVTIERYYPRASWWYFATEISQPLRCYAVKKVSYSSFFPCISYLNPDARWVLIGMFW